MSYDDFIKQNPSFRKLLGFILFAIMFLGSVWVRLPLFGNAGTWWRAQQTMLTTLWFVKDSSISLANYQTPIYGPPFQVPFEFPLIQKLSAIVYQIFISDISIASQIVSLIFFYLCAVFLFLLCYRHLSLNQSVFTLLAFIWSPYMIWQSTEPLIDYPALAFALCYLLVLNIWLDNQKRWLFLVIGILSGSMGYLVKATSMPIILPTAIFMIYSSLFGKKLIWRMNLSEIIDIVISRKSFIFTITFYLVFPLGVGSLWTHYCDAIKNQSVFTAWLETAKMSDWFFGTWKQKLSLGNWLVWLFAIRDNFFPGVFLFFPLAFGLHLANLPIKARGFLTSIVLGIFFTLFLFFNLFLHEYYYITLSTSIAIIIGVGIDFTIESMLRHKKWPFIFFCILIIGDGFVDASTKIGNSQLLKLNIAPTLEWSIRVKELIPENEYVLSIQGDWYPEKLFFVERKGLIISPRHENLDICQEILNEPKFSTILTYKNDKHPTLEQKVFSCFNHQIIELLPGVYRVSR